MAGRKHGILITAGTLIATVIGAGSTIGASGVAFYVGISASWYLLSACLGLGWRMVGFEKDTDVHMLNISLPLSFITMVLFSLLMKEPRKKTGMME